MTARFLRISLSLLPVLMGVQSLHAQDDPHWGVQGDYYVGQVPEQVVELLNDLVEKPAIDTKAYSAGIVRFHENGSPSWAVEFSKTQLTIEGSRSFTAGSAI